MNYLDLERVIHILICIITVLIGIGFALLCTYYEENIRLAQAVNSSREIEYIFPRDRWFNISE